MIRALHDAAASFTPPEGAEWDAHSKPNGNELVCHNDLAPWNLVCAPKRWAFIDWDASAPSTPLWDLAWSAISFPAFVPECKLTEVTPAMHALLNGYGLETGRYEELIGLMCSVRCLLSEVCAAVCRVLNGLNRQYTAAQCIAG